MALCRIRDRLYGIAVGPPANQEVRQLVGPMSAQIASEMDRLQNLYELMSVMAHEIRDLLARS